MQTYPSSNMVLNHQAIFLPIKFNLTWATDSEIRELMLNYYYTQDMVYPNENLMVLKLQNKADLISDYWNKIAELKKIEYDPIENYNRYEESTDNNINNSTTKNDTNSNAFEYPMQQVDKKPVSTADGTNNTKYDSTNDNKHSAHIHGNIGVTTTQQMMQSEFQIQALFTRMKEAYIKEYENLFMVVI